MDHFAPPLCVLWLGFFHFRMRRLIGYHKKPNKAAITATTMAINAPTADNPAPGPIYAVANSGKRQTMELIRIATAAIRYAIRWTQIQMATAIPRARAIATTIMLPLTQVLSIFAVTVSIRIAAEKI